MDRLTAAQIGGQMHNTINSCTGRCIYSEVHAEMNAQVDM